MRKQIYAVPARGSAAGFLPRYSRRTVLACIAGLGLLLTSCQPVFIDESSRPHEAGTIQTSPTARRTSQRCLAPRAGNYLGRTAAV